MKYFFKLTIVSILYALLVFVPLELMFNVYRISRLTNWEISSVNILTGVMFVEVIIVGTILLFFLTKKWLDSRRANFWTVILWVPYFILFIYIFASLFPMTNGGDVPNPVTGLLALGGLIVYPFYVYGREDPILKEYGGMFNQMSRVGMNRLRTRDGSSYLNCSTD